MMDNKKRLWLSSSAGVALAVAVLVLANAASQFLYLRLDFSKGNIYSVSKASVKILRSLPDPVLVKVYYSKNLPPQITFAHQYLRDLLREYESASNGNLKCSFFEINEDPQPRQDALKNGIAPVSFNIFANERYEQIEGFQGLTLQYRDKKEIMFFEKDIK